MKIFIKKFLTKTNDFLISDKKFIKNKFTNILNYPPDLKNPRTFNEKINWRKLYDRKKNL